MAPGAHIVYVGGTARHARSTTRSTGSSTSTRADRQQLLGDPAKTDPGRQRRRYQRLRSRPRPGIGVYFSSGDNGDDVIDLRPRSRRLLGVERHGSPRSAARASASALTATATAARPRGSTEEDPDGQQEVARSRRTGAYNYGWWRRYQHQLRRAGLYQKASCPRAPTTDRYVARVASCRTSRWTATRRPACSSARRRHSPARACTTASTASAARASSSPLFAGLMALADQKAGKGLGLVTPTLYKIAAGGRLSTVFRDPAGVSMGRQGLSTLANVRPDYVDTTDPHSQYDLQSAHAR